MIKFDKIVAKSVIPVELVIPAVVSGNLMQLNALDPSATTASKFFGDSPAVSASFFADRVKQQSLPEADHGDLYAKAEAFMEKGEFGEAHKILTELMAKNSKDVNVRLMFASALQGLGRAGEAEDELRKLTADEPNDLRALAMLAQNLESQGKWNDSVLIRKQAIALAGDNLELQYRYGLALHYSGNIEEAATVMERSKEFFKNNPDMLNLFAIDLYKTGKKDAAIAVWREAIDIAPLDPDLHKNLGKAMKENGQLEDAIVEFEEVTILKPFDIETNREISNLKKMMLGVTKDFKPALEEFDAEPILETRNWAEIEKDINVRFDTISVSELIRIGERLIASNRYLDATLAFQYALRKEPGNSIAHYRMADACLEMDRLDRSIEEYRTALELDPENVMIKNKLDSTIKKREEQLKTKDTIHKE